MQRTQAQHGRDVAGEYEKWVLRNGEDGGDRVQSEDQVGACSSSRRTRGKRKRRADPLGGVHDGGIQVIILTPRGAVAHTKLNGEVCTQPDAEHRECHRDWVERADHHLSERRSDREPDEQAATTAKTVRNDCSAIQRMSKTMAAVSTLLSNEPSCSVANSSSAIGTVPVRRTSAS
jgi:hypothetical protein